MAQQIRELIYQLKKLHFNAQVLPLNRFLINSH